jgi:hypothetical protein
MTVCDIEVSGPTRGCHSVWLDTFQARGFYEAPGYELFGMLDNYPAGQAPFLEKAASPSLTVHKLGFPHEKWTPFGIKGLACA